MATVGRGLPPRDETFDRLMELTKSRSPGGEGNPYPVFVRLTDPALFRCRRDMSEPGGSFFGPRKWRTCARTC